MKRLLIKLRQLFSSAPNYPLTWSQEDFEKGMKWAKSQFDPDDPNRSLWDRVYIPRKDSVDILNELNKFLK